MLVLVTYDVSTQSADGARRLRNVAKACIANGQRVQNSVFECLLSESQYCELRNRLERMIDSKVDSLRFYNLGNHFDNRIIHIGAKQTYAQEETLMI